MNVGLYFRFTEKKLYIIRKKYSLEIESTWS